MNVTYWQIDLVTEYNVATSLGGLIAVEQLVS